MPTAKELKEKRAPLAVRIREMADKFNAAGGVTTAEDDTNWAAVNKDYDALTKAIDMAERAELVWSQQSERSPDAAFAAETFTADQLRRLKHGHDGAVEVTDAHRAAALNAWFRCQLHDDPTEQQAEACQLVGFNPRTPVITLQMLDTQRYRSIQDVFQSSHPSMVKNRLREMQTGFGATLGTGSGAAGGYLIPPETMIRSLEINMLAFGGMRQVAETMRTATGERMSWPTADDTSNTGAQLGESTSIGSSVDPSFGKVYWDAYKFSSKPILVPYELLQDSFVNLPQVLGDMLGERLGRATNTKFTTGTGAATCKGVVTAATAFSAASATAIAGDDILGLFHAIDPAYRSGFAWMMHDSILLALRKLKDGVGNYLWQSGLDAGAPDSLLGYPITINQDMDSTIASGKKTILGGQLSKYKIRTVGSVRLYRLEERYRDTDQDAFIAFTREDGNLLTAGTAPVKYLSH